MSTLFLTSWHTKKGAWKYFLFVESCSPSSWSFYLSDRLSEKHGPVMTFLCTGSATSHDCLHSNRVMWSLIVLFMLVTSVARVAGGFPPPLCTQSSDLFSNFKYTFNFFYTFHLLPKHYITQSLIFHNTNFTIQCTLSDIYIEILLVLFFCTITN